MRPFAEWLAGKMAGRRLKVRQVEIGMKARGHAISRSMIGEYKNDTVVPPLEKAPAFADYFDVAEDTVADLIKRSRSVGAPTPQPEADAAAALLQRIEQKVDAMYRAFDRGEVVGGWASEALPELPPGELPGMAAADRGRLFPVPVADNRDARELPVASVVWIDPGGEPVLGKIVLVDQDGVKRLKKYAPGDDVIGVGRLVQWTLP